MKITLENQGLMTLKDNNFSFFMVGIGLVALGLYAFLFYNYNIITLCAGALFFLSGIWLLISTKIIGVRLDKSMRRCTVSMSSLIKKDFKEFGFGDIKSLTLNCFVKMTTGRNAEPYYQYSLDFLLNSGQEIPLEFGTINPGAMVVFHSSHEEKKQEAQKISTFIGINLSEVKPPPIDFKFTTNVAFNSFKKKSSIKKRRDRISSFRKSRTNSRTSSFRKSRR